MAISHGVESGAETETGHCSLRERNTLKLLSLLPGTERDPGPVTGEKHSSRRTHNPGTEEGPTTRFKGRASGEGPTTLLKKKKGHRRRILAGSGLFFRAAEEEFRRVSDVMFCASEERPTTRVRAEASEEGPGTGSGAEAVGLLSHIAQALNCLLAYVTAIMYLQIGCTVLNSTVQREGSTVESLY